MTAKWGAIGVGDYAAEHILPSIAEVADLEVVGSRSAERSQSLSERLPADRFVTSYEAVLQDPAITHVYVGVPTSEHVEWTSKALDAGKRVLCEKPFCTDVTDALEFVARYGLQRLSADLMVGWMYRHHQRWREIKNLINSGEVGSLVSFDFYYAYVDDGSNERRHSAASGGGALALVGCYGIHIAQSLFDLPVKRVESFRFCLPGDDTDMRSVTMLDFDSRVATVTADLTAPASQLATIRGTLGTIRVPQPVNAGALDRTVFTVETAQGVRSVDVSAMDQFAAQAASFSEPGYLGLTTKLDLLDHTEVLESALKSPTRMVSDDAR